MNACPVQLLCMCASAATTLIWLSTHSEVHSCDQANLAASSDVIHKTGFWNSPEGKVYYIWMPFRSLNSFTGNSVILRHSCYTTATLLTHCKPHFCSQQHIFQRKSLLACQIHWIVLQKHFPTTRKYVFRSIPQIGFARERVKSNDNRRWRTIMTYPNPFIMCIWWEHKLCMLGVAMGYLLALPLPLFF